MNRDPDSQWTRTDLWRYLDEAKKDGYSRLSPERKLDLKLACDEMMAVFTEGELTICPAWYVGSL